MGVAENGSVRAIGVGKGLPYIRHRILQPLLDPELIS